MLFTCKGCGRDIRTMTVEIVYGKFSCPHCGHECFMEYYKEIPKGLMISGTWFGPSIFESELGLYNQLKGFFENGRKK